MKHIALIVTGTMEQQALVCALDRWAAGLGHQVSFTSVQWPSFTSANLAVAAARRPVGNPRSNAGKLAAAALAKLMATPPADFAVIVDDLELVNQPHPHLVASHFCNEAKGVAETTPGGAELLASRVSLHLAAPMIESWLFPDPQALQNAGSLRGQGRWRPKTDAETFVVTDSAYDSWYQDNHPSAAKAFFVRHPKRYLNFLTGNSYREAWIAPTSPHASGAKALAALDWSKVPQPSPHMAYLHALLDDLSDMLGATYPHAVPPGTVTQRRSDGVLRNL